MTHRRHGIHWSIASIALPASITHWNPSLVPCIPSPRITSHRPVPHRRNAFQNRIASHRRNVFVPSHRIAPSRDDVTVPSHRPVPCQRVVPIVFHRISRSKAMEMVNEAYIPQTKEARLSRGSYLLCIELPLYSRIAGRQVPEPRCLSPAASGAWAQLPVARILKIAARQVP